MPDITAECEQAAYADGLAAGLAVAFTGLEQINPPGRVAAVPAAGHPAVAPPPGVSVVARDLAAGEGVAFIAVEAPDAADHRLPEFGLRLGAVRLGVTRRLLDGAVRCLSERTSGGEPTIRKQLVLGTLADAMTTIEVARQTLRAAKDVPAAIAAVHDQLTEWDWEIAKLFGGSGYVAGTPTRGAYVARLAANCWIPREGVS